MSSSSTEENAERVKNIELVKGEIVLDKTLPTTGMADLVKNIGETNKIKLYVKYTQNDGQLSIADKYYIETAAGSKLVKKVET
jgi:hypothetical protein